MKTRNNHGWGMLRGLLLSLFLVSVASAGTIYVPADYSTIQAAITNAAPGDLIEVADGTYVQSTTLTVNKSLTIHGASEAGVIIDASAVAGYGFSIAASDVTLSTFTLLPTTPNYPIHASGTSNPPGGFDNLTLEYITIVGAHQRTGFDIHGYNNVILSFLTSKDATGGNGVSITGCVNVSVDNITTENNAWGSFAIYCSSSSYLNRACDDVTIYGDTCSFGETNLYLQDEFGLVSTNITVDGYEYIVRNMNYRPDAAGFYHYQDTLGDATALALYLDTIAAGSYIIRIDDGSYVVVDGMAIQPAIDAAVSGDVINLGAGSFGAALSLNIPITLNGANAGIHPAVGTHPTETVGARGAETILTNNYPAIVPAADNITIDGIMFTGDGGRIIDTYSNANFFHLTNCIFDNGATGTTQGVIQFGGGSHTDMTLDFNLFQDKGDHTFYTGGGPFDRLNISWNKFNVEGDGLFWAATPLVDGIIQGNELDGTIGGIPGIGFCTFNAGQVGNVQVLDNWAHDVQYTPFQLGIIGGSVIGNTVERVYPYDGYWASCFELWGGQWGTAVSSNVTFEDNTFSINDVAGALYPSHGLRLRGPEAPDPGIDGTTIVCRDNMFLDGGVRVDALAIWHQGDPTMYVDAVENWWDDATGPYNATGNPGGLGAPVGDYVDFDPWWADLAMTTIGSNMPVYNVTQGTYHPTIQDGIDNANPGDLITIDPGSIVADSQIVIDKDLTIQGAGSTQTVIEPGFNTTVGYYLVSDALIFVDYGVTATIEDLAIDGSGWTVRHAVQSRGTHLTVNDCEIRDIYANIYAGRGLVFLAGTGLVENCTMSNIQRIGVHIRGAIEPTAPDVDVTGLTYTGKGVGDFLDYGVEFGGGGTGTMTSCVIADCYGIAESDGSNSAGVLITDYYGTGTDAFLTDCTITGNSHGVFVGYNTGDLSTAEMHDCDISGNSEYGVYSTGPIVDALGNWWGEATGPYHPTNNPGGLGNEVSDYVLFEPWTGMADIAILPASSGPINCSQSDTLTFHYTPDAMTPDLRGYSVTFDPDVELSMTDADVAEIENFDLFDVVDNGDGTFTVDAAMFTGTLIDFETDLFSVVVSGAATGTANVQITDYYLRDAGNFDFFGVMNDAVVEVDCIAPGAATDLAAEPGHNKVFVTWTDPGDVDLAYVEIWRGMWHDGSNVSVYPEYDDDPGSTIPTRPADRAAADASAEWEHAGTVAAVAEAFVDNIADRGIYYYELFAIDTASNYGPPTAATDRATSYWLADVAPLVYDGFVDVGDISKLGAAYGTAPSSGVPPYNNEVDVGPTDDHSGTGIPDTDDYIGFEDMMIFALNYSVVGPAPFYQEGSEIARLAWGPIDASTWALMLEEPCADLKAIHLTASVAEGIDVALISGDLLGEQTSMVFLENIDENGIDVSLGLMGSGVVMAGSGELFRVQLSENYDIRDLSLDLRNSSNEFLDFELLVTDVPDTPMSYRLAQNFPNPFNPKTTIRFDLPEAQAVRLAIYDTSGRQVALLVDEIRQAGYHAVVWNGTDHRGSSMASGIYFYRIEAGPLSQTTRMMLIK